MKKKRTNIKKPLNSLGWMEGTALPHYRSQVLLFEKQWRRKLNPLVSVFACDVCLAAMDPGLLFLSVNRQAGQSTPAAPAAPGIADRRLWLGHMDDAGQDTRQIPSGLAICFAKALAVEPDFVLAVMPQIRALHYKGVAAARWEDAKHPGKVRDLRVQGGESITGIMLGVLDDDEEHIGREDTIAAAKTVAPHIAFQPAHVDRARNEHRKRKPYEMPAKPKAKKK